MIFLYEWTPLATCIRTYNEIHTHTRQGAIGGNRLQAKERTWEPLIDRVATDLRAAGKSEMKCEMSVAHIRWLESCDAFHKLMYKAVTADSCRVIQVLHWELTFLNMDVNQCNCYIPLLLFAIRQDRQCTCDVMLTGVHANIGGCRCSREVV